MIILMRAFAMECNSQIILSIYSFNIGLEGYPVRDDIYIYPFFSATF